MNEKQKLPRAPDPMTGLQYLFWYISGLGSAFGIYHFLRHEGVNLKEPFNLGVYVVWVGIIIWGLRRFILSGFKLK
jgi:hypothetical protein